MPDNYEDPLEDYYRYDPQTGEYYIDEEAFERDLRREARRQKIKDEIKEGIHKGIRAEQTRRIGRYYWRNRGRLRRATRFHKMYAKRAMKKALAREGAEKAAVKVGGKLLASEASGGLGLVLFIPDIINILKSKKLWKIVAIVIAVIIGLGVLFGMFIIISLKQYGTGGGMFIEAPDDLAVNKSVDVSQMGNVAGTPVTRIYTLTVTNNTNAPITEITVKDESLKDRSCQILSGTLQPGETGECEYSVIYTNQSDTRIGNYAEVAGLNSEGEKVTGLGYAAVEIGTPKDTGAPCTYPLRGANRPITQGCNPNHATIRGRGKGNAVDIAGVGYSTEYTATISGVMKRCVNSIREGMSTPSYGVYVLLDNGDYQVLYGHMKSRPEDAQHVGSCYPPKQVSVGEPIGTSNNTGMSTGAHLHYEIRKKDGQGKISELLCPSDGYLQGTASVCQ